MWHEKNPNNILFSCETYSPPYGKQNFPPNITMMRNMNPLHPKAPNMHGLCIENTDIV